MSDLPDLGWITAGKIEGSIYMWHVTVIEYISKRIYGQAISKLVNRVKRHF